MDLMTYLATAAPETWHQVAWQWSWDDGFEPLQWIAQQPSCDRGTALLIYWYSGPRYLAQFANAEDAPDYLRPQYDFALELERAYVAGAYTRQEIAFNPADDVGFDWTGEYANEPLRREIPAVMYEATPGASLERDESIEATIYELLDE